MNKPILTPWLSILIPVYNVKIFLDDCFGSIIPQCDSSIEIIVLDDCSSDESLSHLRAIADGSPIPIKILHNPVNQGISAVRNSLLDAACGEYLWFFDSDDIMEKDAIAELREIVSLLYPDLVLCDYRVFHELPTCLNAVTKQDNHIPSFFGCEKTLETNPIKLFEGLFLKGKLHLWTKISRRSLWREGLQFPLGRCFEDMAIVPRLALRVNSYYYTKSVWVAYRQRVGSIIAHMSKQKIDDLIYSLNGVLAEWESMHPKMESDTRLIYIRFLVKTFFTAREKLEKIHALSKETIDEYKNIFYENTKIKKSALIFHYLRRGHYKKAVKILLFL